MWIPKSREKISFCSSYNNKTKEFTLKFFLFFNIIDIIIIIVLDIILHILRFAIFTKFWVLVNC